MPAITNRQVSHRILRFALDANAAAGTVRKVAFRTVCNPIVAFDTATETSRAVGADWQSCVHRRVTAGASNERGRHSWLSRLTEGFYDTASLRSQKCSQHGNSLPKRKHVAKEAVSAALQTRMRQRSERICKPNDASKDEAAALRKNHVVRPVHQNTVKPRETLQNDTNWRSHFSVAL